MKSYQEEEVKFPLKALCSIVCNRILPVEFINFFSFLVIVALFHDILKTSFQRVFDGYIYEGHVTPTMQVQLTYLQSVWCEHTISMIWTHRYDMNMQSMWYELISIIWYEISEIWIFIFLIFYYFRHIISMIRTENLYSTFWIHWVAHA